MATSRAAAPMSRCRKVLLAAVEVVVVVAMPITDAKGLLAQTHDFRPVCSRCDQVAPRNCLKACTTSTAAATRHGAYRGFSRDQISAARRPAASVVATRAGHERMYPSEAHFFVASMPIL